MAAAGLMLNAKAPEFQMPSSFNPDAPEFKPVESSLILRPEAAEFIPMAGGWATLQAAAEAYQNNQNKQKRMMPYATDEEWEQRIQKREKEVETIKSLQSYRLYIEVFPHEERGEDDPKTPDPRERTVSKRMWKWNVEKWRLQLKSRCVYSRAILLQCREELSRLPADEPEAGPADASLVADAGPNEQAASSGQALYYADASSLNKLPMPMWRAVKIPDQPRTIPNSGSRKAKGGADEAGYRTAPAGSGSFQ